MWNVECGICERVCPVLNYESDNKYERSSYAAWSYDESIRINSTSGGIFSEIACYVITNGGCVVGARYSENQEIYHTIIDNIPDIKLLRQSKYAQSRKGNIFEIVEKKLENGITVLFVGAPCETAVVILRNYNHIIILK